MRARLISGLRRGLAALCLGALAAGWGCAARSGAAPVAAPDAPLVLAVATWNLHSGQGDLPRFVADLAGGKLTGGVPAVPFVLLLQEVVDGGQAVMELAGRGHLSGYFSPVRPIGRGDTGNAILSSLPLVNARTINLPRQRQPRAAVAARVVVGGRWLFVASAHLENRVSWLRGGLLSDSARGRQARALVRALPSREPGIVGGDFNTWLGPTEPAWRLMLERFVDTPRERPAPTFRDRLVLDHLFFDLPAGWQAGRRVVGQRYGSDHHPVLGLIVAR